MMRQALLVAPILIPLVATALTALLWARPAVQRLVGGTAAALLFLATLALLADVIANGMLVGQMGSWPAPFGISLVVDHAVGGHGAGDHAASWAVTISPSMPWCPGAREREQAPASSRCTTALLHGRRAAPSLTGDLFNLYVWFEVMLIASFGLLVLDRTREQIDGGIKLRGMLNLVGDHLLPVGA
jgi:multicomponent Na+:H+ antiporter subunit D